MDTDTEPTGSAIVGIDDERECAMTELPSSTDGAPDCSVSSPQDSPRCLDDAITPEASDSPGTILCPGGRDKYADDTPVVGTVSSEELGLVDPCAVDSGFVLVDRSESPMVVDDVTCSQTASADEEASTGASAACSVIMTGGETETGRAAPPAAMAGGPVRNPSVRRKPSFRPPECAHCGTSDSVLWSHGDLEDAVVCYRCHTRKGRPAVTQPSSTSVAPTDAARRGTAAAAGRRGGKLKRQTLAVRSSQPKGRSRRAIFKKTCVRAPSAVATPVTSDFLFYKGVYYQVGDIVSVLSLERKVYYAQIRGLLQDQYCEKSAVLTWLLPTKSSPPPSQGFDPTTYVIGPDEDLPRKLECMEFVCQAPSDYYHLRNSPYPTPPPVRDRGFIYTRLGPKPVSLRPNTTKRVQNSAQTASTATATVQKTSFTTSNCNSTVPMFS